MPAAQTTPSKRGTPKAKGAVRAKSGCYTCRIRRKKCDEQLFDGRCRTCVRLRLECLGFGPKRPEWLRETRNVTDVREKIKNFLASHGMIKGHTGSVLPQDSDDHELPTLRLSDETSDSSQSPPTPTLSLSSCSDTLSTSGSLTTGHPYVLSSAREEQFWDATTSLEYSHPGISPSALLRPESPFSPRGSIHDYLPALESTTSLVQSPATQSLFSRLSHFQFNEEEYDMYFDNCPNASNLPRNPTVWVPVELTDGMVQHYIQNVVYLQYLFAADGTILAIITETISHKRTREAARLLASVHNYRFYRPQEHAFQQMYVRERLESLNSLLSSVTSEAGDAIAALHVVSSILFDGGQGSWKKWLAVANRYVDNLFGRWPDSPGEVLLHCSPKDAFIIKTTLWFDVLASVTTQEVPHFLPTIRGMFGPQGPKCDDACTQYSMMSPMGCENVVVWALAETSALAHWKAVQQSKGCLSMPDLVYAAHRIESHAYDNMSNYPSQPRVNFPTGDVQGHRQVASEIFRAAARLYLRTVVSGDHPQVPEIKQSVKKMIQCIQDIDHAPLDPTDGQQTLSGSIVRSTVFGFFICGAFADDADSQAIVFEQLRREGDGAGNCGSVRKLLEELQVGARCRAADQAVPWRQLLKDTETLLV